MSQKRILIVEDDPALAQVIMDNLTFEEFQVDWVSDGGKALTAARTSPPDLVLLDLMLPGRDGLRTVRGAAGGRAGADHHPVGARPEGRQARGAEARAPTTT